MLTTVLVIKLFSAGLAADTQPAGPLTPTLEPGQPGQVGMDGWLGAAIDRNIGGRLTHVPMDELLAGFQHRPGKQAWVGEHIGKWLHAAGLAYAYSNDGGLRRLMDDAVKELVATQKPDGYLGTYVDGERWTSWDVWVHKYNLIGLLAYHDATHNPAGLDAARRIGDLLVATFGSGKRDIIAAGTHVGMAATSVLEPMVKLYRATGEKRYLDFCRYLVDSWDQPNGPKILASLLDHGKVNKTANSKAYEMMSNLVGLCGLCRVVGDERYLKAARNAWDDIARNQLYLTGGTSLGEHFQPDGHLPDVGAVAETCANVTWVQLSIELLALTGESKYADAIEQLVYNHLPAAQAADGNDWCYFTPLRTRKSFTTTVNCCHSSGPRGVALLPTVAYCVGQKVLRINLYGESRFKGEVPGVGEVEAIQQGTYPAEGRIVIEVRPAKPTEFRVELRVPPWANTDSVRVNGTATGGGRRHGLLSVSRAWQPGDKIELDIDVSPRWVRGEGEHAGMLAVRRGPLILCASRRWNPDLPTAWIAAGDDAATLSPAGDVPGVLAGERSLLVSTHASVLTPQGVQQRRIVLGPYAAVQNETFAVWLFTPANLPEPPLSCLYSAQAQGSRGRSDDGTLTDGDATTHRVTHNRQTADLDFWQATLDTPTEIRRVVFRHGRLFHDGGWFDTSAGKPEVLVQTEADGSWKPVGRLEAYPDTTADKRPGLTNGQPFELKLPEAMRVYGVRVTGKPASGDDPKQAFSSCAELEAYSQ